MKKSWSMLAGLAALVAPLSAAADNYNILNPPMYHKCGAPDGSWWGSDDCNQNITYGPYATNLPPGPAIAVSTFKALPKPSTPTVWYSLEINENVSHQSLVYKDFFQVADGTPTTRAVSVVVP